MGAGCQRGARAPGGDDAEAAPSWLQHPDPGPGTEQAPACSRTIVGACSIPIEPVGPPWCPGRATLPQPREAAASSSPEQGSVLADSLGQTVGRIPLGKQAEGGKPREIKQSCAGDGPGIASGCLCCRLTAEWVAGKDLNVFCQRSLER